MVKSVGRQSKKFLDFAEHPDYPESLHFKRVTYFVKGLLTRPDARLKSFREKYNQKFGDLTFEDGGKGKKQKKQSQVPNKKNSH